MDSSDLRVFESVARLGGMSRAAEELHTVQSNVTARVRALEEELGAPLFHRHSRGVTLTPAGQRLMPYAERVRHLLTDARRAFQDAGQPSGGLTIGSLETTAALRLSHHLTAYASAYPEVDLVLRTGTTCELIQDVLERRLEGAFVCGPVDHPALISSFAFREELALLTAPNAAPLHQMTAPKLVVLRAGCSYRERLEEILRRRGVHETRLLEFGTLDAILACVAAGIGITLLPRALVPARPGIAVHTLPPREAEVETVFIQHRDAYASSALAAFVDMVQQPLAAAAE